MRHAFFLISFLLLGITSAQSSRIELNLSGSGWRVWLDSAATWKDDVLHLPRTLDLSKVETRQPGCGWQQLYENKGIVGKVPASFEELFGNGNPLWRYHGVGWFSRELEIPANWNGKTVRLHLEKARLRVEVYVNEQLAGYDIVAETPYTMDVSSFVKAGTANRLAIRITNPGGQRGWNDAPATEWGTKYKLIPGHDFGGLGNVSLTATDNCYIEDLFVKNSLPANGRNIQLQLALRNKELQHEKLKVEAEIVPYAGGKAIYKNAWDVVAARDTLTGFSENIQVPDAKLWDTENPNLYYCRVKIFGEGISDEYQVRFGFRVFEVKANADGQHNFYLNGKRVRIRSAIDWGYYWQTGFYPTDEQARKNVENARRIGLNCLSFHRRIGEPLVMKYADELGLMIYGEPGGMPGVDDLRASAWIADAPYDKAYHAAFTMPEKFSRMVKRDRNHPSVVIWNLVNEQCTYDNLHKKIFDETWKLDNSRLVVNQSGGQYGDASGYVPHMRPYEFNPRLNLIDDHTVLAKSRFQESDLKAHQSNNDSSIIYWGEVRCYTGPDNFYLLSRPADTLGYDYKSWKPLGDKTEKYFRQNNFNNHPFISQRISFQHFICKAIHHQLSGCRPVENAHVKKCVFPFWLLSATSPGKLTKGAGLCTVYCFSIIAHPDTHFFETFHRWSRYFTLGSRPYIQQVIPAFRRNINHIPDQHFGRFPVVVKFTIPPGTVHGHTRFPVFTRNSRCRNILFRSFQIAMHTTTQPVVRNQIGILN